MNLANKIFSRLKGPELAYIDIFYDRVVSDLSPGSRRQYCVNLIGRIKSDLNACSCPEESRALQELLRAAKSEIRYLGKLETDRE